jgi:hypothetical protein
VWPIVICTEPFEALARINAKAKNAPDVDLVIVDHPLGSRGQVEIDSMADEIAERVRALVGRVAVA